MFCTLMRIKKKRIKNYKYYVYNYKYYVKKFVQQRNFAGLTRNALFVMSLSLPVTFFGNNVTFSSK